ncbi:MAG: hypothetical protein WDM80_02500 [Limisphaerales bacterium]
MAAWKKRKSSLTSADRLCLVWSVVVVIFFSLSKSKLPGYILTVTVACGILLARLFQQALANPDGKAARIIYRAAITLAVLCCAVAIAAVFLSSRMELLAKPTGLSVEDAQELGRHFTTPVVLLSVFAVLGLWVRFRCDAGLCFALFAIFPLLLFTLNLGVIGAMFNIKSARNLAQQFPALSPEIELAFFQCFPNGLPFYLNRTATVITQNGEELTSNYIIFRLKNDPVWPTNMVRTTDFNRWLAGRKHPVYLVANEIMRSGFEKMTSIQKTNIQTLAPSYIGVLFPTP